MAWPRTAGETDAFDRVAANLERQWYDDGRSDITGDLWVRKPDWYKVAYLAHFAVAYGVSFERFAAGAAADWTWSPARTSRQTRTGS